VMDGVLHPERIDDTGAKVRFSARLETLPDGAFVRHEGNAALVWGGRLRGWSFEGYQAPNAVPAQTLLEVLTPRSIVRILAAGYKPRVHASAAIDL